VRQLPHEGGYYAPAFSPDGRWLVTSVRSEFRFWEVGSWDLRHRLPRHVRGLYGYVSFARDGGLVALAHSRNLVHLRDASTLRHLATLETPGQRSMSGLSLSPDGSRLAVATDNSAIGLWDLRRLREELARLGLDW
jgi:WD40 repeat protein